MSKSTVSAPKAHALLGASSSARWLACSPSARVCEDIPETESPYAAEGTLAHEICELKLTKAYTVALGPKAFTTRLNKLKKQGLVRECFKNYFCKKVY